MGWCDVGVAVVVVAVVDVGEGLGLGCRLMRYVVPASRTSSAPLAIVSSQDTVEGWLCPHPEASHPSRASPFPPVTSLLDTVSKSPSVATPYRPTTAPTASSLASKSLPSTQQLMSAWSPRGGPVTAA